MGRLVRSFVMVVVRRVFSRAVVWFSGFMFCYMMSGFWVGQAPPYDFLPQADATAGVAAGRHAETVFVHFFVFEDAFDVVAGFVERDLCDPFV